MSLFSTTIHRELVAIEFDESNDSEITTLGGTIWDALNLGEGEATVVLSPTNKINNTDRLQTLVCWANRSPIVSLFYFLFIELV